MNRVINRVKESPKGFKIVAALLVLAAFVPVWALAVSEMPTPAENIVTIHGEGGALFRFDVELAVTPQQMAKGLMEREELKEGTGMLFLFKDYKPRNFWMKNTLIPLDILFIRADGIIGHIHPMAKPLDTSQIRSFGPARAVLEINGGEAERLGIKVGQIVQNPAFGNM